MIKVELWSGCSQPGQGGKVIATVELDFPPSIGEYLGYKESLFKVIGVTQYGENNRLPRIDIYRTS
jgi:hypothetical protein